MQFEGTLQVLEYLHYVTLFCISTTAQMEIFRFFLHHIYLAAAVTLQIKILHHKHMRLLRIKTLFSMFCSSIKITQIQSLEEK